MKVPAIRLRNLKIIKFLWVAMLPIVLGALFSVSATKPVSAACQASSTDFGSVVSEVNLPGSATYRVWTRIMIPSGANNTYLLEVDGSSCFTVGGGTIASNTWTWVDYRDGNTASKTDLSLAGGKHTIKMIGNKPDVKIDRLVFTSDLNCTPTGNGDNCNTPSDTTAPTVKLTAPTDGSKVSGTVDVTAAASDNTGITKVELYVDSTLIASDASSPYSFSWNTSSATNGQHRLTVRAYDAANNVSTDSYTVDVQNGDTQAPSTPTNVKAAATSYNNVTVTWSPSSDNTGVTGYTITRNDVAVGQVGVVTSFVDQNATPNTQYAYRVIARDAAGNKSLASAAANVQTPSVPDTQAPSVPVEVTANAISQSQINLNWKPSTDNIGVSGYEVYRIDGASQTKLATISSTSYGVTGLNADTTYSFAIRARDAAGNISAISATATAKTQPQLTTPPASRGNSVIYGAIRDSSTNRSINKARVTVVGGSKRIFSSFGNGYYAIIGLSAGRYTVTYSAPGYHSKSVTYTIGNNSSLIKNIKLDRRR